ncbi:DUF3010 family protein [Marinobacter sp. C2H3]|uniref:DUF3010 family protein n=1 Tax=Marinobacter sp. C2H3 TaxID=3119003 RepID=UPI00300E91C9
MIVCGVELTGSDAVVCLLGMDRGQFTLPECKARKLSLPKSHSSADLKAFQDDFAALMAEHGVTRVAIKERMTKGRFAGGAVSFKLEATLQLIAGNGLTVTLLPPALIKSTLADKPLPIAFADTGLKAFQEAAFVTAYVGQLQAPPR